MKSRHLDRKIEDRKMYAEIFLSTCFLFIPRVHDDVAQYDMSVSRFDGTFGLVLPSLLTHMQRTDDPQTAAFESAIAKAAMGQED